MRKKFTSLQNEIDVHKEDIKKLQGENGKLNNVIKNLEKDIAGLKKEIQERDETIQVLGDTRHLFGKEMTLNNVFFRMAAPWPSPLHFDWLLWLDNVLLSIKIIVLKQR